MRKGLKLTLGVVGAIVIIGVISDLTGANKSPTQTSTQTATKAPTKSHTTTASVKTPKMSAKQQKAIQLAELKALGDWGATSGEQEFHSDYTDVEASLNAGNVQSAYEAAKRYAAKADQWNTDTISNQDMQNVPSDIPANVRSVLRNVDPNLAEAYMYEKMAFNSLADGINKDDLSKLHDTKTDMQLADADFANAKAFITRAEKMLR